MKRLRNTPRAEALGKIEGIDKAGAALQEDLPPDAGEMRIVALDEVHPDPNNPRRLGLDWTTVQKSPEDISDVRLRDEVSDIQGLAKTILKVGQRQPCEVIFEKGSYTLIFGERRYWACRIAKKPTLKVTVLRAVPENVALVQLIENIHQKKMPLYETILNIRSIITQENRLNAPIKDATDLMNRTGLRRATAYRYWRCIELPKDIEACLKDRTLKSHDDLSAILKFTSIKDRKAAIARFKATGSFDEPKEVGKNVKVAKSKKRKGGRPSSKITFGQTKNTDLARHIITTLDPDSSYDRIDWTNFSEVSQAWKAVLEKIESNLKIDS